MYFTLLPFVVGFITLSNNLYCSLFINRFQSDLILFTFLPLTMSDTSILRIRIRKGSACHTGVILSQIKGVLQGVHHPEPLYWVGLRGCVGGGTGGT